MTLETADGPRWVVDERLLMSRVLAELATGRPRVRTLDRRIPRDESCIVCGEESTVVRPDSP
jgi:hypothetical protein